MAKEFLCEAASPRKCSIEGCGKPIFCRGFCSSHYERVRRHGDPFGGGAFRATSGSPMAWVDAHIDYSGDDCLLWPFNHDKDGYGRVVVNGKTTLAHRYMLTRISLPPTPSHHAAHNCGNGHLGCANPRHLSWKTPKENEADKIVHGTQQRGPRNPRARLTEDNILDIISRAASGEIQQSIAASFGVSKATIGMIMTGRNWSYLTGILHKYQD